MKKGFINYILILLLVPSVFAITYNSGYVESNYDYIHVSTLKYEPYPVQPGRYFDLWLRIENTGNDPSGDITFTLQPRYPFKLAEYENETRPVASLKGKEVALLHYKIRTDSNAVEGYNQIGYKIMTGGRIDSATLNIFVQTSDANIAIDSVDTQEISPGGISDVTLNLRNEGDTPLSDVSVKLDFTSANIPFVPINSSSEKKIYVIEPQSTVPLTFTLLALPDAVSTTYKVPIEIKFIDGVGNNYTKSSLIGLTVGSKPDIRTTAIDSKIYSKGETGDITLKFTNKGLTDIKFLDVVLENSPNYDVLSANEVYIGNIDSDDYETADFRIKAKKVTNGFVNLNVTLDYMDSNNKRYHETGIVNLKVVSAKDLGISSGGSGTSILLTAIIVIGVGYYLYKRWEKKKLHKK